MSNFIDDEEFFVLSDLFEWKNVLSTRRLSSFQLNEMTESEYLEKETYADMIAVFHIKFISSILNTFELPYLNIQINLSLTSSLAGLHSCCHSSK